MAPQGTNLATELDAFAAPLVRSGRYANAEEVLHAAMDALRREQCDEQSMRDALLAAAEEGEASGMAEGDIFARVRAKHGLRSRVHG